MVAERVTRFMIGFIWVCISIAVLVSGKPIDGGFLGCIIIANVWLASK